MEQYNSQESNPSLDFTDISQQMTNQSSKEFTDLNKEMSNIGEVTYNNIGEVTYNNIGEVTYNNIGYRTSIYYSPDIAYHTVKDEDIDGYCPCKRKYYYNYVIGKYNEKNYIRIVVSCECYHSWTTSFTGDSFTKEMINIAVFNFGSNHDSYNDCCGYDDYKNSYEYYKYCRNNRDD